MQIYMNYIELFNSSRGFKYSVVYRGFCENQKAITILHKILE
uniref:Uncharacterized protein n=1 Tax=Arundo donax TaxID=35708 RepID=A0A0A9HM44_ARUDO